MPKVSIIVPLYNKSKYISSTLDSIKKQKFRNFEVIIVNDGSTDNSLEIVRENIEGDARFLIVDIQNSGVSNARNTGMKYAKGEWIQFLDGDDLIDEKYLESVIELVEGKDIDIVFTNFLMIDENKNKVKKVETLLEGIYNQEELCKDFIIRQYKNGFYGYISNKLIRRSSLLKAKAKFPVNISLAEDLDFYAHVYPIVDKVYFSSINSFYYLQTDSNYLNNFSIDYFSQLKIHLDIKQWFVQVGQYEKYKKTIDKKIGEYVYFVLFHEYEKSKNIEKQFKKVIKNEEVMNSIVPEYFNGFERNVLKAVRNKKLNKLKILFDIRGIIRFVYRRIRKNG